MNKTIALLMLVAILVGSLGCRRQAAVFEIPEGYVGWVHVRYLDETCPPPEDRSLSHSVIRIGDNGIGCSSTWSGEGLNAVLYYYVDAEGQRARRLESTGWGQGGEIWGGSGFLDRNIASFFVGSEEAFQETKIGSLKHLRETRPDWLRP